MNKRTRISIIAVIVILVVAGGVYFYRSKHHKAPVAQTTSKSPTAQPDYTGGDDRKSNTGNDSSQGGAVDTGGNDAPKSEIGVTSDSGLITVTVPAKNDTLKNNAVIGGTAKAGVDTVQYRLLDEQYGLLGQGQLNVVNGAFSGKLQFTPRSDSGRLDIFSYDSAGAEVNTVEIPVGLSQ